MMMKFYLRVEVGRGGEGGRLRASVINSFTKNALGNCTVVVEREENMHSWWRGKHAGQQQRPFGVDFG